jgi:hypothetical protein
MNDLLWAGGLGTYEYSDLLFACIATVAGHGVCGTRTTRCARWVGSGRDGWYGATTDRDGDNIMKLQAWLTGFIVCYQDKPL